MHTKSKIKKSKIKSTKQRYRLSIFRSQNEIYAQIVDDYLGNTLVEASSLKLENGGNIDAAKQVGKMIADKAKTNNIKDVIFDRGNLIYHGRVAALADHARNNGLNF